MNTETSKSDFSNKKPPASFSRNPYTGETEDRHLGPKKLITPEQAIRLTIGRPINSQKP